MHCAREPKNLPVFCKMHCARELKNRPVFCTMNGGLRNCTRDILKYALHWIKYWKCEWLDIAHSGRWERHNHSMWNWIQSMSNNTPLLKIPFYICQLLMIRLIRTMRQIWPMALQRWSSTVEKRKSPLEHSTSMHSSKLVSIDSAVRFVSTWMNGSIQSRFL